MGTASWRSSPASGCSWSAATATTAPRYSASRSAAMAEAGLPAMVIDGEIAVPDERGVTHLDALSAAISARRPERPAYFAFDLLHLDGHDLRRYGIEDRKLLLRDVLGAAGCERIVYVDHVVSSGRRAV